MSLRLGSSASSWQTPRNQRPAACLTWSRHDDLECSVFHNCKAVTAKQNTTWNIIPFPMGLRMDDIHAPTIASGPTSQPTTNGTSKKQTLQELSAQKENLEAELSALSSVLDSVSSCCTPS